MTSAVHSHIKNSAAIKCKERCHDNFQVPNSDTLTHFGNAKPKTKIHPWPNDLCDRSFIPFMAIHFLAITDINGISYKGWKHCVNVQYYRSIQAKKSPPNWKSTHVEVFGFEDDEASPRDVRGASDHGGNEDAVVFGDGVGPWTVKSLLNLVILWPLVPRTTLINWSDCELRRCPNFVSSIYPIFMRNPNTVETNETR